MENKTHFYNLKKLQIFKSNLKYNNQTQKNMGNRGAKPSKEAVKEFSKLYSNFKEDFEDSEEMIYYLISTDWFKKWKDYNRQEND